MDAFFCLINVITVFQVLYLTFDCQFKEQSMALDKIETTQRKEKEKTRVTTQLALEIRKDN